MYRIKVDTALLDGIAKEYNNISESLFYEYESVVSAVRITGEFSGFDIEALAELLYKEAVDIKSVGEDILCLRRKTERISEIYRNAERNIERDVNALPVLIHGNISAVGDASEIMNSVVSDNNISGGISESALLCDNTVMHEDWLIKLIAKNKFGG
ncbi:MAG: hypothetical protein K2O14_11715 [Oscillospiraceae bacterium]|nr:hypothetical protein [Oscillospiraceae bacterium]